MKYGDLVIGNKQANRYGITTTGTTWIYVGHIPDRKKRDFHMADIYIIDTEDFVKFEKYKNARGYSVEEAMEFWNRSTIFPVRSDRFDVVGQTGNKDKAHLLERLED